MDILVAAALAVFLITIVRSVQINGKIDTKWWEFASVVATAVLFIDALDRRAWIMTGLWYFLFAVATYRLHEAQRIDERNKRLDRASKNVLQ